MKGAPNEYMHAGIHTLMRSPFVGLEELDQYDVGIVGVPLDYGVSFRDGTKQGPKEIREYSHWDKVDGSEYFDLSSQESVKTNRLKVADLGDIHLSPTDAEENNTRIITTVNNIRKKVFPIILGGDHSVTYSSFIGCSSGISEKRNPTGLLVFDAHPDVEKDYLLSPRVWHGNFLRMLIEEDYVKGENVVLIGPRGVVPKEWIQYLNDKKIKLVSTYELKKTGIEESIDSVVNYFQDRCDSVYLSFDIDCIDPADAPGTGTPSWNGIRAEEVIRVIRRLKQVPLVGADLTEFSPPLDSSGKTAVMVCDVLWNILSFDNIL